MAAVGRLGTYFQFVRISFLKMLAYRLRYYTGIVTYLLYVSVYWFIWKAVYVHRDSMGGFSLEEMTTYVAVGWIARSFYFNNIDFHINEQVVSGKVAFDLLKPIDFHLMNLSSALGESLFRLLLFAIPTGIAICLVFPVMGPASLMSLLGFVAITILAFVINVQVGFLIGLISFRTQNIWGIMRVKYVALQLLSGLIIPISLYPELVQKILYMTPFPYIANVPLSIYLGKLDLAGIVEAGLISLCWVLLLYGLGKLTWRFCRSRLIIQGG